MIVTRGIAAPFFARLDTSRFLVMKGVALSHALGISLFVAMALDRVWRIQMPLLPFLKPVDLPILLTALWLILDRRGRIGTVKISWVDYLFLGFVAVQALSYLYSDLFLIRFSGFWVFADVAWQVWRPYLFFIVVREGLVRRGFRADIALYWLLAAFAFSALIGLMQARNVPGVREWSYNFYKQRIDEMAMDGPSAQWQAKGVTPHANTMAHTMWLALAVWVGMIWRRRPRPVEILLGLLLFAALVATYSRAGVIAITAIAVALVIFMAARKMYKQASITLTFVLIGAAVSVMLIWGLNIERLKPLVGGASKVVRIEELGGWNQRIRNSVRAVEVGMRSPFFGVQPVGSIINNLGNVSRTSYSFPGKLDNSYSLSWVNYGVFGPLFIVAFLFILLRTLLPKYGKSGLAVSTFLIGIGYLIHFNTENLLFIPTMMVPLLVLALVEQDYELTPPPERIRWKLKRT
jgi:hypothetical protein